MKSKTESLQVLKYRQFFPLFFLNFNDFLGKFQISCHIFYNFLCCCLKQTGKLISSSYYETNKIPRNKEKTADSSRERKKGRNHFWFILMETNSSSLSSSPTPAVPRLGVAVSSIEPFIDALGGPDELSCFTTKEVVNQYILPTIATKHHSQR